MDCLSQKFIVILFLVLVLISGLILAFLPYFRKNKKEKFSENSFIIPTLSLTAVRSSEMGPPLSLPAVKYKLSDIQIGHIHKSKYTNITIPKYFDSREAWPGCISRPFTQGSCGSCWAFASVSVLEDRFCIASCKPVKTDKSVIDQISKLDANMITVPVLYGNEKVDHDKINNLTEVVNTKHINKTLKDTEGVPLIFPANYIFHGPEERKLVINTLKKSLDNAEDRVKAYNRVSDILEYNLRTDLHKHQKSTESRKDIEDLIKQLSTKGMFIDCSRFGGRCNYDKYEDHWLKWILQGKSVFKKDSTDLSGKYEGFFCGCCPMILNQAKLESMLYNLENINLKNLVPSVKVKGDISKYKILRKWLTNRRPNREPSTDEIKEIIAAINKLPDKDKLYCIKDDFCAETKIELMKRLKSVRTYKDIFLNMDLNQDLIVSWAEFEKYMKIQWQKEWKEKPDAKDDKFIKSLYNYYASPDSKHSITWDDWIIRSSQGPINLSVMKLVVCASSRTSSSGGCLGNSLEMAWRYLRDWGTTSRSCIEYTLTNWSRNLDKHQKNDFEKILPTCDKLFGPKMDMCKLGHGDYSNQILNFRAKNAYSIIGLKENGGGLDQIQLEIMQNGPVSTAFHVYEDFNKIFGKKAKGGQYYNEKYDPTKPVTLKNGKVSWLIYDRPKNKGGTLVGGHSIKIIGWGVYKYKDSGENIEYWICMNSWGYNWGTGGDYNGEGGMPFIKKKGGCFWMRRGVNLCELENNVVAGQASFKGVTFPGEPKQENPIATNRMFSDEIIKGNIHEITKKQQQVDNKINPLSVYDLSTNGKPNWSLEIPGFNSYNKLSFFWPQPKTKINENTLVNVGKDFGKDSKITFKKFGKLFDNPYLL